MLRTTRDIERASTGGRLLVGFQAAAKFCLGRLGVPVREDVRRPLRLLRPEAQRAAFLAAAGEFPALAGLHDPVAVVGFDLEELAKTDHYEYPFLDELIDHHGRRLDEVEAATRTGATTAFEVAGVLRWTRREHKLEDLDPFNAMLAVFETGAHLDLLVTQGRLTVTDDGGVRRYA